MGLRFWLEEGVVRMSCATPPAPDLVEGLRLHRDAIAALLVDHDAPEQEAMRLHYAARAGPDPMPDPLRDGLFQGFYAHRHITKKD